MGNKKRDIREFTIYKIKPNFTYSDLSKKYKNLKNIYSKNEINIYLENRKKTGETDYLINWLLTESEIKNEFLTNVKTEAIINTLLIDYNGDFFIIGLSGTSAIEKEWVDKSFFPEIYMKLGDFSIKEQKIINPNSEIAKTDQDLKGGSKQIISDIGDFFSGIKFNLIDEIKSDTIQEKKLLGVISKSISIFEDKMKGSFLSEKTINSIIIIIKNLIEIRNRNKTNRSIDFLISENDKNILKELYLKIANGFISGTIKAEDYGFNDDKISSNFVGIEEIITYRIVITEKIKILFEKYKILSLIQEISGNLKGIDIFDFFEDEIRNFLENIFETIEIVKENEDDYSEIIQWLFFERTFVIKIATNTQNIMLFDLVDIWEISLTSYNESWFMISGQIYINGIEYSEKLEREIERIVKLGIVKFVTDDDFYTNYPKKIKREDEYNKYLIKDYWIKDESLAINTDKKMISSASGMYEISDTFIKKKDKILFIANKQAKFASQCHKVFSQSIIAMSNFKPKSTRFKSDLSLESEFKVGFYATIHHEQDGIDELKNKIKSISFRTQLVKFYNEAQKHGFEPKVYILKKDEIDELVIHKAKKEFESLKLKEEYKKMEEKFLTFLK